MPLGKQADDSQSNFVLFAEYDLTDFLDSLIGETARSHVPGVARDGGEPVCHSRIRSRYRHRNILLRSARHGARAARHES
jgi:hypothetical protein